MQFTPRRRQFNIMREQMELNDILTDLQKDEEVHLFSFGGFSSIAFIHWVAARTVIRRLDATTLAVGKKHALAIDGLHHAGRLDYARFIVGHIAKESKQLQQYGYFDALVEICNRNGWEVHVKNNHSKVILMDTDMGKFVLITSSNLNENPSAEQFCFLRNDDVYGFYLSILDEIVKKNGEGAGCVAD